MTQADIDRSYRAWYHRTWPRHVLAAPYPYHIDLSAIDLITREAVRLFRNTNWCLRTIGDEFDEKFAKAGAKTGLHFRQPLTSAPPKIS